MTTHETKSGTLYVRQNTGTVITDASGNGIAITQASGTHHQVAVSGTTTSLRMIPVLELASNVTAQVDKTPNIGTEAARLNNIVSQTRTIKTHDAFTGSASYEQSGAVQTTNNTATTIATIAVIDNCGIWIEANATGRDTAGATRAWINKAALYYRQGGGAPTAVGTSAGTSVKGGAWGDVTFAVSGNSVLVQVTGAAATTINWAATVRYQSVSGNT